MSPTILIVDDEEFLRDAIAIEFERRKFEVRMASSGREALAVIEREHIDVVISDVRMPNGDGLELLDALRNRNPAGPPLIFITGYADLTPEEALRRGASGMFGKPFDRRALSAKVDEALAARAPPPPAPAEPEGGL